MAQTSSTNGASAGMPAAAEAPGYQLIVNSQYLKDLSFENPRAPQTLLGQREAPAIDFAELLRREHERALKEQEVGGAPQATA